ncbi:ribonuclease J [Litchfieldella xinjiangensis]|uniref:ribonuclease J n=1 Tax=Litchfieldella xinjiangensis TaxID=1166948 RepID=UPI0005BCBE32|nr:ribonuclease J [Halomonas xinjiangensis]
MNLGLYGYDGHWIAIDCGMMIRQDLPGSPLQVPNTATLDSLEITPQALFLTHGHEDHIGAVAWVWPRWGCPIYATPLAAGLLRAKFIDRGLATDAIEVVEPGEALESGPFTLRYLPVTHSIPESCALLIATPDYRVLHTGDWKLDPKPLIGDPIDPATFRALAPVDLVVGDSTNAPVAGHSRSESEVASALAEQLPQCAGRVIVTCFASNLDRVLAIGRSAARCGRRVSLMGRSMERMVGIARGLGYLDDFPPLVPVNDLGYLPPEEVLVIATGSQGEPRAALTRLAHGSHPNFELVSGDSVIFSAKAIPGNERLIERLQRALTRKGVAVYDEQSHPELHASGHPAQEELKQFYQWVEPRYLLPVHGEQLHQQSHCELAQAQGIQAPLTPTDGDMIRFDQDGLTCEAKHPQRPCIVDQNAVVPLPGLADTTQRRQQRYGSLFLALPVAPMEQGWARIGRLLIDTSASSTLDEDAFADWLDERLTTINADSLMELRRELHSPLMQYLSERLRHMPEVHLQVVGAEAP